MHPTKKLDLDSTYMGPNRMANGKRLHDTVDLIYTIMCEMSGNCLHLETPALLINYIIYALLYINIINLRRMRIRVTV